MKCPFCGNAKTNVIFTGKAEPSRQPRRRQCPACGKRFNTFERPFIGTPMIIKSDGTREEFDREKLMRGLRLACVKRPVPAHKIVEMADNIERALQLEGLAEVPSRQVGDLAMDGLKGLDYIAYIRFALVYLRMDDLHTIRTEIDKLLIENESK